MPFVQTLEARPEYREAMNRYQDAFDAGRDAEVCEGLWLDVLNVLAPPTRGARHD